MACWCETNDKEKTKAVTDAEAKIEDLTTKIEELTASSARLNTEIKNLEKDSLQAISALKSAITVLGKHHGGAFLQLPQSHLQTIASTIQYQMQKHASVLQGVLTHTERRAMAAFIQAPQDYFDAEPTFKQSYAPQSGEIFGILKQMKESFESNLSDSQKEEL